MDRRNKIFLTLFNNVKYVLNTESYNYLLYKENIMRKKILVINFIAFITLGAYSAHAFIGGLGSVAVLGKILAEAIKQYKEMKKIVTNGQDLLNSSKDMKRLMDSVNSGIDNALNLLETLPIKDENILSELRNFREAYSAISDIYGRIPIGPEARMLEIHDQTIAESLKVANLLKSYAEKQEQNARFIINQSPHASPKGAARMNAQGTGAILFTLNQILRVNGQILKLQSEILGMQNKGGKEAAYHYHMVSGDIQRSLHSFDGDFSTPKF
jgi:hypothetical protein